MRSHLIKRRQSSPFEMSRQMTLSRTFYFPVILILGAGLTAGPVLAQTADKSNPPSQEAPSGGTIVEDIVAKINDQIVTQSDYERALQQMDAEGKQQGLSPRELQDRKNNLLRDLVDQQLLLSKGKELGITGEADLVRRLDDIRKQNHLATMEDLEKAAATQGVSYEDFKSNIRNSIITQQVVRDQVGRHLNMSQSEVQAYYKAHESEFAQPESVNLSEILISTPANPDAAQVAAAQASADAVAAKLRAGAKFADIAKASSSGPTAAQGGDLGDFRRGMLAPQLEEKTFNLKAGQFTDPIRTKQGFVILEVTHHTEGGDAAYKQVEPQVEQAVFMQHMQPALRQYLTKLREGAAIFVKPGFVDSGASPNEMQFSFSAYVPPAPKKKQKFIRRRFSVKNRSVSNKTQVAGAAAPAAGKTAAGVAAAGGTAAGGATVSQAGAGTAKTVAENEPNVMKPGKREKIRFGQAPRESLPSAQNAASAAAPAESTQSASAANPDVQTINPDGTIGGQTAAPVAEKKTRFSARPVVHKTKQQKVAEAAANDAPPPTADELATQKVQAAPLGLADQAADKKKKVKAPKTRYSARPKAPDDNAQPYQPASTNGSQPPGNPQPAPNAPASTPPQ